MGNTPSFIKDIDQTKNGQGNHEQRYDQRTHPFFKSLRSQFQRWSRRRRYTRQQKSIPDATYGEEDWEYVQIERQTEYKQHPPTRATGQALSQKLNLILSYRSKLSPLKLNNHRPDRSSQGPANTKPKPQSFELQPISPAKPQIVILSLQDESFQDSRLYKPQRVVIGSRANIIWCFTPFAAWQAVRATPPPQAILIADAGIVQCNVLPILCARYMRRGGRVVCAANFANSMPSKAHADAFFEHFRSGWQFGDLRKGVEVQKAEMAWNGSREVLMWPRWCPKQLAFAEAQLLTCVRGAEAAYRVCGEGTDGEAVQDEEKDDGASGSDSDATSTDGRLSLSSSRFETPIAWAKRGKGFIGYIGDVNAQNDGLVLLLAMLGLLRNS